MLQWLGLSAVNPLLLWGALAIAAPIIIHLLSKRRFRVVEWAAMDFLFDADKRNRRRVRMENLILLLLRCLAVVLIALLVSRPFLSPAGVASLGMSVSGVERIILLDDSPSTQTSAGRQTAFDEAKDSLQRMVRDMADQQSGDTFTLVLTSDPESPLISGRHPTPSELAEIEQTIDDLRASDLPANLDAALLAIEDTLDAPGGNVNRALYVLSDLRRRDWAAASEGNEEKSISSAISRIAEKADSFRIVDIGNDSVENLLVSDIAPKEKTLVAGVEATFDVTVQNAGTRDADDVELVFSAENTPEMPRTIENIPAGQSATVPFTFKFGEPKDLHVQASLGAADVLGVDNVRHYAAHITEGVQVLVVDGDPSSEAVSSESHFLHRALAPDALLSSLADEDTADSDRLSGNVVEVVSENQFETLPLAKYQIIYLCNLYRVSEDRYAALESWVKAGGGLVIFLGDQVDAENYNQYLYAQGKGLLPATLEEVRGDETEEQWANINVLSSGHPVVSIQEQIQNAFANIHIFRWWKTIVDPASLAAGQVSVPAALSDEDASPLIVDKSLGDGRVLLVTTSADADWTDWPADPTYPILPDLINRYMARAATGESAGLVGTPIHVEVDPSKYMIDARVHTPEADAEPVNVQAAQEKPAADKGALQSGPASAAEARSLAIRFDDTNRHGVYRFELDRRDGGKTNLLYAANLDPSEGDLRRIEDSELRRIIGEANVEIHRGNGTLSLDADGSRTELWKPTLLLLGGVLCFEQALAWLFGRRRT